MHNGYPWRDNASEPFTAQNQARHRWQRLWARRAGNSRPYAPNRPQRPVLLAQATEMSGYFRPPEISSICADCLVVDAVPRNQSASANSLVTGKTTGKNEF